MKAAPDVGMRVGGLASNAEDIAHTLASFFDLIDSQLTEVGESRSLEESLRYQRNLYYLMKVGKGDLEGRVRALYEDLYALCRETSRKERA